MAVDGRETPLPKKKRKLSTYLPQWEKEAELAGWLTSSKRAPGKAYCTVCDNDLAFKCGGFADLKRHGQTKAHQENARRTSDSRQKSLRESFAPRLPTGISTAAANGELRLAFFLAEHHLPLTVADHLVQVVKCVCPDSAIAGEMRAARTKMTAAVNTVADAMHADLVKKMKDGFWAIIPDETADISVKEQVGVSVRVFDESDGQVRTYAYGLRPVKAASAANIFSAIELMLASDNLDWSNLVAMSSDGANVMCGKQNSLLTRISSKQPNVFSVHCTCHAVHLCASDACKKIPGNLDDFLRLVVHFF